MGKYDACGVIMTVARHAGRISCNALLCTLEDVTFKSSNYNDCNKDTQGYQQGFMNPCVHHQTSQALFKSTWQYAMSGYFWG